MNPKIERVIYLGLIVVLAGLLVSFGKKEVELQKQIPLTAQELYQKLANPNVNLQIIDVRPYEPEDEDYDDEYLYYTDIHLPGAIPLPNCDESQAPEEALEQINPYIPTVIVSKDGDPEIFKKCAQKFKIAQNLAGGVVAWDEAGLPTEDGEYEPPKMGGGGGCL